MRFKKIQVLWKAEQFEKALAGLEELMIHHKDCPHLWNLRGDLIQLVETQDGPPLAEAEKSYKRALRLNANDLEALESLAHFYDAVDPNPAKAKRYAEAYIARAKRGLSEMERVIAQEA
ncbi:MAG TPA: hypothetical protein VN829_13850 [Dongiaceae bacterium]|nr:hypothetical protein [Dongiaceae bacterium]